MFYFSKTSYFVDLGMVKRTKLPNNEAYTFDDWYDPVNTEGNEAGFFEGVLVYSGICGIGKTHRVFELIKHYDVYRTKSTTEYPVDRFIFVTPFISECHRVAGTVPSDEGNPSSEPKIGADGKMIYSNRPTSRYFCHPEKVGKRSKLQSTKELVKHDRDIVTTHASFRNWDEELINLINERNYHLIIDEAPSLLEVFNEEIDEGLTSEEITSFFSTGLFKADETTGIINWVKKEGIPDIPRYKDIKKLCDQKRLILYSPVGKPCVLWRQKPEIFNAFQSIRILTFLFNGSIAKAYFDLYQIPYTIKNITKEEILSHRMHNYHDLVTIHESTIINRLQLGDSALSSRWYDSHLKKPHEALDSLKKATGSFFKNTAKTPSELNLWTVFGKARSKLAGDGYTKGFIACNERATNIYRHTRSMAYLINVYMHPILKNYLGSKGVVIHEDSYSMGEMIQWIFRSQIRDGKPIMIFIPSIRMKRLLNDFLRLFKELKAKGHAEFDAYIDSSETAGMDDQMTTIFGLQALSITSEEHPDFHIALANFPHLSKEELLAELNLKSKKGS